MLRDIGPRTWLEALQYTRLDYALTIFGVALLVGSTVLNLLGYGDFWVPPSLL